jgi:hypothetical protein
MSAAVEIAPPVRRLFTMAVVLVVVAVVATCNAVEYPSSSSVSSPPAAKLAFDLQPTNVAAGADISPPVIVAVQDGMGNVVTTATSTVTIAVGTNPAHGTLSGTTTVGAIGGFATFVNLIIDSVGTGYTLTAAAAGLTGATSSAFSVTVAH